MAPGEAQTDNILEKDNKDVELQVGMRVLYAAEKALEPGVLRFKGTTKFGTGEWCGVELDKPLGKNDGSVKGDVYFECTPNHGIFVREGRLHAAAPVKEKSMRSSQMSSTQSNQSSFVKSNLVEDDHLGDEITVKARMSVRALGYEEGVPLVDGRRAELLEKLWTRVDSNGDGFMDVSEFERFVLAMDEDIDEESIPGTFEDLLKTYCASNGYVGDGDTPAVVPKGLDFAFFVDMCGHDGLQVSNETIKSAWRALDTPQEVAATAIQKVARARRARKDVQNVRLHKHVLTPAWQLRAAMTHGGAVVICVLSDGQRSVATSGLVAPVAQALSTNLNDHPVHFVVSAGAVGADFVLNLQAGSLFTRVAWEGEARSPGHEPAVGIGRNAPEYRQIFSRLGDIYVTFDGAAETAEQARLATEGGAVVLPFPRSGGASQGAFNFPPAALQRPAVASEETWKPICDPGAPAEDAAAAAASIVKSWLDARAAAMANHQAVLGKMQAMAGRAKMMSSALASIGQSKRTGTRTFRAEHTVDADEAGIVIEAEFEQLLATWRPRGARRGVVASEGVAPSGAEAAALDAAPAAPPASRPAAAPRAPPPPPPSAEGEAPSDLMDDIEASRRRMEARLLYQQTTSNRAALLMQAAARGCMARRNCRKLRGEDAGGPDPDALMADIDASRRRMQERLEATHQRAEQAAIMMQSAARGCMARRDADRLRSTQVL